MDATCPSFASTETQNYIYASDFLSTSDPLKTCVCPCINCTSDFGNLCERLPYPGSAFIRDGTVQDYTFNDATGTSCEKAGLLSFSASISDFNLIHRAMGGSPIFVKQHGGAGILEWIL